MQVEITEIRVFLKDSPDEKLKAYGSITFDNVFVVRDLKVIEGIKGLFVAMPSKKIKEPCQICHHKNVIRSKYCNQCGTQLEIREQMRRDHQSEHIDIAHPIVAEAREYIQGKVLEAYYQEAERENPQTV